MWSLLRPSERHSRRVLALAALCLVVGAGLVAAPSVALETSCPGSPAACCLKDFYPGANCTANDLTFVLVGLGFQTDGCFGETDTLDIRLRAIVENTTAQTRYDVGMWIATDTDPDDDGAETGTCAREILSPTASVQGSLACSDLDLTCGSGPYYDADGDGCADLVTQGSAPDCGQVDDPTVPTDGPCTAPDTVADASILDFVVPVTVNCTDGNVDGFVDLDVCLSYGNQANQVDTTGDNRCDSAAEVRPGTNAKCQCENNFGTNIPMPDLGLSCSCPGPVRPGQYSTCTVQYTNSDLAACTPDPSKAAEFRCGSAAFFRFETDYDQANGSVSNVVAGSGNAVDDGDILTWNPDSSAAPAGSPDNIVLENQNGSLTFRYEVDPGAADGTITNTVTAVWGESSSFPTPDAQSLTAACSVAVDTTWASVIDVRLSSVEGPLDESLELRWRTAAEVRSLGFRVERFDPDLARFVALHPDLLPAGQHGPAAEYRWRHGSAKPGPGADGALGPARYRIVEVDVRGSERVHGPFVLRPTAASNGVPGTVAGPTAAQRFVARPRADSPRPAGERMPAGAEKALQASESGDATRALELDFDRPGLYRLDLADLAAALDVPPRALGARLARGAWRFEHRGDELAIVGLLPKAENGNRGSAVEALLVYAVPQIGATEPHDVLRMVPARPGRARLLPRPSPASVPAIAGPEHLAARQAFEKNLLPRPYLATDPREDFWFWHVLSAEVAGFASARLELQPRAPRQTEPAELELHVRGFGADEHRLRVHAGGRLLGETLWTGTGWHAERFALDTLPLERSDSGADGRLVVELEALDGNALVDRVELLYRRAPRAVDGQLVARAERAGLFEIEGFADPRIMVLRLEKGADPSSAEVERAVARIEPEVSGDGYGGYRARFPVEAGERYLAVDRTGLLVPSRIRRAAPGLEAGGSLWPRVQRAEHLVLAAPSLVEAARTLGDAHAERGLESVVVDVRQVYSAFHHGVPSPLALRQFLRAVGERGAPVRYVTLVGQGTWDVRDYLGAGGNLLSPILVATAYGLQPSDNALLWPDDPTSPTASGPSADPRQPSIGRIPAATAAEVTAYVQKAFGLSSGPAGTDRAGTDPAASAPLWLTDDADRAGDFPRDGDALAARFGGPHLSLRSSTPAAVRHALLAGLTDAGLLVYLGHGGLDRLADEGLLVSTDVSELGAPKPVVALTCNAGYFAFPGFRALGEHLVLEPHSGAPVVLAPSGMSTHPEAVRLGSSVLQALAEGAQTFGDALRIGAARYLDQGGDPQMVAIYQILGDPAAPVSGSGLDLLHPDSPH